MLMNVLASGVLFLFIGPFKHVSSVETKEAGVSVFQVKDVYIAVNDILELNCSINASLHDIHSTQLSWKHNNAWTLNFTHIVNNNTIQLRKNHTQYDDAGVYECGLFNSSKLQSIQKITVVVGEKPTSISYNQFDVTVYGKPVQQVTVEWQALQANLTNELFVGRVPVGNYFCEFNSTAQCKQTARFRNEMLSCSMGMEILGNLFQRNELLRGECKYAGSTHRCDTFCAKVVVKNAFGTSESGQAWWNLVHKTRCPPLHNLSVSLGEHNITVSWQRPPLVLENFSYTVYIRYNVTTILTEKVFHDSAGGRTTKAHTGYISINTIIVPFARYKFTATCSLYVYEEEGPAVYTEVTSKEAAPKEAPHSCEVKNRSRHDAFVSWKAPSVDAWQGMPRKFLVGYGNQIVDVYTSRVALQTGYNRSATSETIVKDLDPHKNYNLTVAMCTGGGCGKWSEPCFIPVFTEEEDSNVQVVADPGKTNDIGVATWVTIAFGVVIGTVLVVFFAYSKRRKRFLRNKLPSLGSRLGPLNGIHPYENDADEGPSFCEDGQFYDSIYTTAHRPLLSDMDCTVANFPVTEI